MKAGALGAELRLSGKLPSERAKQWRFASGYLKKTGDPAKIVNRAQATAITRMGVTGIKVAILPPDAKIHDRIIIDDIIKNKIKTEIIEEVVEKVKIRKSRKTKPDKKEKSEKKIEEKQGEN